MAETPSRSIPTSADATPLPPVAPAPSPAPAADLPTRGPLFDLADRRAQWLLPPEKAAPIVGEAAFHVAEAKAEIVDGRRERYRREYVQALAEFDARLKDGMPKVLESWHAQLDARRRQLEADAAKAPLTAEQVREKRDAEALLEALETPSRATAIKVDSAALFGSYVDGTLAAGVGISGRFDTDGRYKFLDDHLTLGLGLGLDRAGNLVAGPAASMKFQGEDIRSGFAGSVNLGLGAGLGGAGVGALAEGRTYLNDGSVDNGIADQETVRRKGVGLVGGVTYGPMGPMGVAGVGLHADQLEGHKRRVWTVERVMAGFAALGPVESLEDFRATLAEDVAAKADLPYGTPEEKAQTDKLVRYVTEGVRAYADRFSAGGFDGWDVEKDGERVRSPERQMCLASALRAFGEDYKDADLSKIEGWDFQSATVGVILPGGVPIPVFGPTFQKVSKEFREDRAMLGFQVNLERTGDGFQKVDFDGLRTFAQALGGTAMMSSQAAKLNGVETPEGLDLPLVFLPLETSSEKDGATPNEFAFDAPKGLPAGAVRVTRGKMPAPDNRPAMVVALGKGVTGLRLGALLRAPNPKEGASDLRTRWGVYVNPEAAERAALDLGAAAQAVPANPDAPIAYGVRAEAVQRGVNAASFTAGIFGATNGQGKPDAENGSDGKVTTTPGDKDGNPAGPGTTNPGGGGTPPVPPTTPGGGNPGGI